MSVYKDKNGTWYVMTRCDDWQGQRKQKCKRGLLLCHYRIEKSSTFCNLLDNSLNTIFKALSVLGKARLNNELSALEQIRISDLADEL